MIEVQNVSKSFKDVQILKNVSTVFEEGKVNCIIGRSGSGKTVLMKSIVGLHEIDEGKILFHGRNYTDMTDKQRKVIRKEIGMVFQSGALFVWRLRATVVVPEISKRKDRLHSSWSFLLNTLKIGGIENE